MLLQGGSERLKTAANNDLLFSVSMQKNNLTHKLIGDVRVVPAGHSLTDGGLHEARQGGQHVDRGVNLEHRNTRASNSGRLQFGILSNRPVDLYTSLFNSFDFR